MGRSRWSDRTFRYVPIGHLNLIWNYSKQEYGLRPGSGMTDVSSVPEGRRPGQWPERVPMDGPIYFDNTLNSVRRFA